MVSIPAGPVSILLQVLEKVMRPLVPITAGQLMSFTSDGLAAPNESFDDGVTPVREILRMVTNR